MVCPPTEVSPKINRRPVALGDGEPGVGEGRAAMDIALTIAMAVAWGLLAFVAIAALYGLRCVVAGHSDSTLGFGSLN